jgi:hypothetical protein
LERGCPADGALIDVDHLVELLETFDRGVGGRLKAGPVEMARGERVEGIVDERGFTRARDAGDADEAPDRDLGVDRTQVVAPCAQDAQLPVGSLGGAARRDDDAQIAAEIAPGQ